MHPAVQGLHEESHPARQPLSQSTQQLPHLGPAGSTTTDSIAKPDKKRGLSTTEPTAVVSGAGATAPSGHRTPAPRLGWWNVYFLAKLVLYWKGIIGFHALENLAFAALLLIPLRNRALAAARLIVAVPIGAALLYYDSWLPPFSRLVAQFSLVSAFSLTYLVELAGRFISWPAIAALTVGVAGYALLATRLRVGAVVLTTLLALAIVEGSPTIEPVVASAHAGRQRESVVATAAAAGDRSTPEAALRAFHEREATRRVAFTNPPAGAAPFDVVFLHVCSLSWDDLRATGLDQHPLLGRLDIVLTRFNSAASYSGPAVIRVLRAPCGQSSHAGLYSPVPEQCYLLPSLKRAGMGIDLVLNHDGHFDDFLKTVRAQGLQNIAPMAIDDLPIAQRSFDQSPIFDDLAVLTRWSEQRRGPEPRAALYNTISLHDGNRLTGPDSHRNSLETYKFRLEKLLDDLNRFLDQLERQDRPTVVVLVPEHGAAFRGDKMQIAGMREIPTPAITLVPAGIKVIGAGIQRRGPTQRIDTPTSYLAISQIIAHLLERPPFGQPTFSPQDYLADLPATDYVAENSATVVMRVGDKYQLRIDKDGWSDYAGPAP